MTFTTTIERLGHLGDGIAPGPLFVPGALPGEVVSGTPDGDRLRDVKIITPSPDRVRPPCRHFKSCGGCSLQHAADPLLADWKTRVVRDALAAQGLEAPVTMASVSPPRARRRATLSGRRTKKGAIVGFHGRASGTIVEIPDCQLLHPDLVAAIPALAALTVAGGSRKGELALAITRSQTGVDVAVTGGKPLDAPLQTALADIARAHDLARLTWNGEVVVQRRPPAQPFGAAQVVVPPGAFLQATEQGQAALVAAVAGLAEGAKNVIDLFAGCGTFSLPLAAGARIHAVEGDAAMLAALDHGWRHATGLKPLTTETRDLFRRPVLAAELDAFDLAVIDPPRAGAAAQVNELANSNIARIAYVSCNPVTFARDVRRLADAGFAPGPVAVVDQFRWSPHVELVAGLRR